MPLSARWSARRAIGFPALALLLTTLSGCGVRAKREALRACAFAPTGVKAHVVGDSIIFDIAMEIRNPGPRLAILDSFSAVAATESPLARISHGSLLKIPSGSIDTAAVHLALAKSSLMSTAMQLAMNPPDSVKIEGTAWIPGMFGGTSPHRLRATLPWSMVGGSFRSLLPGL